MRMAGLVSKTAKRQYNSGKYYQTKWFSGLELDLLINKCLFLGLFWQLEEKDWEERSSATNWRLISTAENLGEFISINFSQRLSLVFKNHHQISL